MIMQTVKNDSSKRRSRGAGKSTKADLFKIAWRRNMTVWTESSVANSVLETDRPFCRISSMTPVLRKPSDTVLIPDATFADLF